MSPATKPIKLSTLGAARGLGFVARYQRELAAAAAYAVLLGVLALLRPQFFQKEFAPRWVDAVPVLVAALGMTLVIIARHIDISIGSQFSVCGVVAGLLAKSGMPMPAVAVCTVAAGALVGALNGGLIAFVRLPSIVVTLATMVIAREVLRWTRQGETVLGLPPNFQWFGVSQQNGQRALIAAAAGLFLLFVWATRWLVAGRAIYAVGSDQEAARLAGVRPRRVVFWVFVLMGALTGLAALLGSVRFPQIDPNAGTGMELRVIAAVVVGGAAITGGRGTMIGTLIGVGLLATIAPMLTFLNDILHKFLAHPQQWELAIQGVIILVAVALDGLLRRGR